MDLSAILMNSLWAALVATGLGVIYTAPVRYLVATFLCGFAGRCVRDVCMGWSLSQNWATLIAAVVVVVVAVSIIRRHTVSPVVLICGVLPLGATVGMFNLILALMQVSSLKGEALSGASVALSANLGNVFTTSMAIAVGLGAGMAIVRLFKREKAENV
jgi:uncharacterized membrane protein YjjB (DUF3815 family)